MAGCVDEERDALENLREEPCIHIQKADGKIAASGTPTFATGHRIPKADEVDDGVFAGWSWDGSPCKPRKPLSDLANRGILRNLLLAIRALKSGLFQTKS